MRERKSINSFRNAKIIQLCLLSIIDITFFIILLTNESLARQIYSNKTLFTLCAVAWVLILFNAAWLLYDFYKLRSFRLKGVQETSVHPLPERRTISKPCRNLPQRKFPKPMREPDIQHIAGLVIRARQNDSNAFAELYTLTYNKVYNYARNYLRDSYLAQDAMQEIYISALKNLNNLNDPTLFIAWLNRISFHVCYDMCRKANISNAVVDPEILALVHDEKLSSNPEAHFEREDEYTRLRNAMLQLPFTEKEVLTMRYYNSLKLEEIAAAMGISRSTVKRYIAAGHEHLKKLLKEGW